MTLYVTTAYYTPALLRLNPDVIFVFGDNTARWGNAGQAVIRNEPNAIGLATKISPSEFFTDCYSNQVLLHHDIDMIRRLAEHRDVVLPVTANKELNLGTGLSDMPNQCPALFHLLKCELPVSHLLAYALKVKPVFETHILWGEDPDPEDPYINSYTFDTQAELDAFDLGLYEIDGWAGFQSFDTQAELDQAILELKD